MSYPIDLRKVEKLKRYGLEQNRNRTKSLCSLPLRAPFDG